MFRKNAKKVFGHKVIYLSIVCTLPVSSSINNSNQPVSDSNNQIIISNIMIESRLCLVCLQIKEKFSCKQEISTQNTHNFPSLPLKHNFRSLSKFNSSLSSRSSNAFTLNLIRISIIISLNNFYDLFTLLCIVTYLNRETSHNDMFCSHWK